MYRGNSILIVLLNQQTKRMQETSTMFVWNRCCRTLWKRKKSIDTCIGLEHWSKIESVLAQKKQPKQKHTRSGRKECTYFLACSSLSQPAMRRDHHWSHQHSKTLHHSNKEKSRIKMGWKKKRRRAYCSKIELVLPQKEEGEKEYVRTCIHVAHFSDVPGGEITIEGTSSMKHCTTHAATKIKVQG